MKIRYNREEDPGMPPVWPPLLGLTFLAMLLLAVLVLSAM